MGEAKLFESLKIRARRLKAELRVLYLAYKDPRVPWYTKLLTAFIVAYAFSPIDLIPDFIPILGYLDDLIIVPLGILLAMKMIPPEVLEDCRRQVELESSKNKPVNWVMGVVFILIWIAAAAWISIVVLRMVNER